MIDLFIKCHNFDPRKNKSSTPLPSFNACVYSYLGHLVLYLKYTACVWIDIDFQLSSLDDLYLYLFIFECYCISLYIFICCYIFGKCLSFTCIFGRMQEQWFSSQ